jgi:hypothetical protein
MTGAASRPGLFAGAALVALLCAAPVLAQHPHPGHHAARAFAPEPLSPFEAGLLARARSSGEVHRNEAPPSAGGHARGLILANVRAAVVDLAVTGRKYGVSLDGTKDVLIKNYTFTKRRSSDIYGSGLILGSKTRTLGQTWLSNAWIDLQETAPNPDYKQANNEAITVERGNAPLNVRHAVLIGAQESGLDNKGDVRMDASFIASGHRSVRTWSGASLVLVHSTVLAYPGFGGFWFGGGKGVARLQYYDCRFGRVGDPPDKLTDTIPDWMIDRDPEDPVQVEITRLTKDPLDRDPAGFWIPAVAPRPPGYLQDAR